MADDIFKQLPLRIIGLGLGISEAARYRLQHNYIDTINTLTIGFVVVHIAHTAITVQTVPAILGSVLFEGVCSCLIPPFITYHVCRFVADWVYDSSLPMQVKKWTPMLVGLLTVPFYLFVVDPAVDDFIQGTFLPALGL